MHDHKKKAKEEETPEQKMQREEAFAATGALYKSLLDHRKQKILMEVDGALAENTALLEKVPEMYTAYNVRRECLTSSIFATATDAASLPTVLARITSELQWNAAVLKKDPKIYAAFVHRYWLIEQLATMVDASSSSSKETCGASSSPCELLLRRVLEKEQEQCEQLLRADERNFHAWNHRRWVLRMKARYDGDEAEQHTAAPVSLFTPQEKQEMAYTLQQIKHNFSNYSAWHQRGLTLQAALRRHPVSSMNEAAADGVGLELHQYLVQDVALLTQAIYCDPKDQSAWFYAPYVLEVLELYAMHLPHDVATTRCAAEVVDGFVADVVEVLVEEGRLGERTGCALPLHFLWSFARGRGMNCPDHALTEREKRYVAWMQEKIPSCCEATNAASVVACLAKELQCVDPMRSGMYA